LLADFVLIGADRFNILLVEHDMVRKWARVAELEMELDGKKIAQYRATTKIYFNVEH
jgi:hypothetical protein